MRGRSYSPKLVWLIGAALWLVFSIASTGCGGASDIAGPVPLPTPEMPVPPAEPLILGAPELEPDTVWTRVADCTGLLARPAWDVTVRVLPPPGVPCGDIIASGCSWSWERPARIEIEETLAARVLHHEIIHVARYMARDPAYGEHDEVFARCDLKLNGAVHGLLCAHGRAHEVK